MRGALVVLLLVSGCRTLRPPSPGDLVAAEDLAVDFPKVGEGVLDVLVPLPPALAQVSRVTWTLKVRGVPFATGVEGAPFRIEGAGPEGRHLRLHVPMTVRHLSWREGAGFVEVGVEGVVEGREPSRDLRLPFAARREVLAQNVPRLDVGEE